jgi:uncharacterized repeat protein (TIGR03837 family)
LEYLSAENYVERSHGLPSPQLSGPGTGLTKWFFYPGFTPRTGGLVRGPQTVPTPHARRAWLASMGITPRTGERVVSLFCYPNLALPGLLTALASAPTLLLLTADVAAPEQHPPQLRIQRLPYLSHLDYDHLLAACDLNFVRGEDSFVRAQWAARPFVWHIYPQSDGAHTAKLQAFFALFSSGMEADLAQQVAHWWQGWNGLAQLPTELPDLAPWQAHCQAWRAHLNRQPDLIHSLLQFAEKAR